MRIPALRRAVAALTLGAAAVGHVPAQKQVNTYWQRESGTKYYKELEPFRKPNERVIDEKRSKLKDLVQDLLGMMDTALKAKADELYFDESGRQICKNKRWAAAYENVKANSLKQEGWLGKVFLGDQNKLHRKACVYGMFYFNNPQDVFHMISFIPGEPEREIREFGYERALEFLRVHMPKSVPHNKDARFVGKGIVVPRYDFNPLPFMQLLEKNSKLDQAQGLWFLTEVLRIRRDLGRAYFDEIKDLLPKFLQSDSPMVRTRATQFLAAIDQKPGRVPTDDAPNEKRVKWFEQLDKELFPPIRVVSEGRVQLYPSEELNAIVAKGKDLLRTEDALPHDAERAGQVMRFGVRVNHLPKPLDTLGIPHGCLIVGVNGGPTRNRKEFAKTLDTALEQHRQNARRYEKYLKKLKKGEEPKPRGYTSVLVEYVHNGKAKMMQFDIL